MTLSRILFKLWLKIKLVLAANSAAVFVSCLLYVLVTDKRGKDAEEEIKVKCPCGSDEVS